jgi:hypothetical protein
MRRDRLGDDRTPSDEDEPTRTNMSKSANKDHEAKAPPSQDLGLYLSAAKLHFHHNKRSRSLSSLNCL